MVRNPKSGKMSLDEAYPALNNIIGYLHQDWKDDYNWEGNNFHYHPVIRFFKTHNPPNWIEQATKELKEFLAEEHDEEHLEDYLYNHFILGTMPSYWGFTFEGFLQDMLKVLEEPIEKTKKEFIPEFIG
jgi:CdiI immunity protein